MINFHQGIDWYLRIVTVTAAVGLLTMACGSASAASKAGGTTNAASVSPRVSPADGAAQSAGLPVVSAANCGSGTTCYSPQQLQAAYRVKPLLGPRDRRPWRDCGAARARRNAAGSALGH